MAALGFLLGLGGARGAGVVAPALPLETQARRAEVIVRGSLGAPQTVSENGVSWRVYPLKLTEAVAGDAARLPAAGGEPAPYVWAEATDLPNWRTGQDAFFLLYTARLDSPLVGYNQGYYAVVNGQVALNEPVTLAPEVKDAAAPAPAAKEAQATGSEQAKAPPEGAEPVGAAPSPAADTPSAPPQAVQQVTADQFRALLLRARRVQSPQNAAGGPQ